MSLAAGGGMLVSLRAGGRRRLSLLPPAWLLLWLAVPAILVALPAGYVILRSWQAGAAGVVQDLLRHRTLDLLVNSVVLSGGVTLCAGLLGLGVAWCTERCDLPGRQAWRVAAALPLAIPAFVSSYAWSSLGPAFQGMAGAITVLTFYSMPLIALPVAASLRAMDPALEDVARSLGNGPWRCFFRVILPQTWPALGGGALLVASHMFGEFDALSFLQVDTFTTAIFEQYQLQFDNSTAALLSGILLLLCLPPVLLELRLRRNRLVARVGKGRTGRLTPIRLGSLRWPVFALFGAGATVAFGVPLVTLVGWLLVGTSAGIGLGELLPATLTSLALAIPGALVTTALAVPFVLLSLRFRGAGATSIDRLPYLVRGLPGIVVALALTFVAIHYVPTLYQTLLLVIVAYAVLSLPLAQSSLRASAELVPPAWEQVARSLGRGPFRAFLTVTLPNILPGIGAALSLIVVQLMRELTATLLLAPSGVATLATEFWSYTNDRAYAAAAPYAAVLVLVSGIPVYIFTLSTVRAATR